MQHFAVVGNPIAHSLSPAIHQQFAAQYHIDLNYSKIKGDELDFEQQINDFFTANGRGLNITLPFKSRAFAWPSSIQSVACAQGLQIPYGLRVASSWLIIPMVLVCCVI